MSRMINCVKLGREAEGIQSVPFPGALGKKIYENVSQQAWDMWLRTQTMIINEHRLNLAEPEARKFLRDQLQQYFFDNDQ